MPEGDTIYRAAQVLGRALEGKQLTGARSARTRFDGQDLVGERIERVESRGKNLLITLGSGKVIHTHCRMTGSWHIYRPGETWRKPASQARLVLETADFVAICFNAPVVDLLDAGRLRSHDALARLGPDLLSSSFEPSVACQRLRALDSIPIGEALLVQGALAGIGNVYKSETLFLCRQDPFTPVSHLEDGALLRIVNQARDLLCRNLTGFPRRTRAAISGPRHAVYGRAGKPCLECGASILSRCQGAAARRTYWCPACQAPGGPAGRGQEAHPARPSQGGLEKLSGPGSRQGFFAVE